MKKCSWICESTLQWSTLLDIRLVLQSRSPQQRPFSLTERQKGWGSWGWFCFSEFKALLALGRQRSEVTLNISYYKGYSIKNLPSVSIFLISKITCELWLFIGVLSMRVWGMHESNIWARVSQLSVAETMLKMRGVFKYISHSLEVIYSAWHTLIISISYNFSCMPQTIFSPDSYTFIIMLLIFLVFIS